MECPSSRARPCCRRAAREQRRIGLQRADTTSSIPSALFAYHSLWRTPPPKLNLMLGWSEWGDVDVECCHEHFLRNAPLEPIQKRFLFRQTHWSIKGSNRLGALRVDFRRTGPIKIHWAFRQCWMLQAEGAKKMTVQSRPP